MIHSWAYDVEIFPNFFSVTFIDINDYLDKFKDCVDDKGKPIPLIVKYKVSEIKEKLDSINCKQFYITDKDDSQLLEFVAFVNNLAPQRLPNGVLRNDLFGYNSDNYDKLMMACFLMNAIQSNTTKELITKLYETSKKIISLQDNKDMLYKDYYISNLRNYNLPYMDVDVMRIFALNKVGKGVNSNGETIYYGKSLKQTSINIQWYELLDWTMPPISDKDRHLYKTNPIYDGLTNNELNSLINHWDRYIIPDYIEDLLHYNKNDVFIVCEMVRLFIDEIRLRYVISKSYGVNVLSSSRSNIADKLFIKFYSEFSGLNPKQWRGKKTERKAMAFKRVIFDNIKFKTKPLQDLLEDMKNVTIYSLGKDSFKRDITINKLTYTIATGGLHSQDIPRELVSHIDVTIPFTGSDLWAILKDDDYVYVHFDISSFYPSIMSAYNIAPKHLDEHTFVKLITWLKDTRIAAKHSTEEYIDGIHKNVIAEALKIVINSIYGKLGSETGDICDRLAVLKVTINGQLMIMMLCEELELNNIEVVSANTDGIVVKLFKKDKIKFDEITNNWLTETKLSADSEEYDRYINRDINNYIIREINGKVSYKGALHPQMYLRDLQKGYDMPIVAKAVVNYFLEGKPVLETLYEETNILMFCKTQNVGKKFHIEQHTNNGIIKSQTNVRFYIANNGYMIFKTDGNVKTGLAARQKVIVLNTLDDKDISLRDIKYSYYYDECMKIIDPIKLQISPNQKSKNGYSKSGKTLLKRYSHQYNTLFDDA